MPRVLSYSTAAIKRRERCARYKLEGKCDCGRKLSSESGSLCDKCLARTSSPEAIARRSEYRRRAKLHYRKNLLKQKYGLSLDEYNTMLKAQNYVCATCGKPNKNGAFLAVDHCHSTNRVRGLLCIRCNTVLGLVLESKTTLSNLINYLG